MAMKRTYNTNGLTDNEITLLDELDKVWLNGGVGSLGDALAIVEMLGLKRGQALLDAWYYWIGIERPFYRESSQEPIPLLNLIDIGGQRSQLNNKGVWTSCSYDGLPLEMLDLPLYFEVVGDKLYAKYTYILGSHFIAYVS